MPKEHRRLGAKEGKIFSLQDFFFAKFFAPQNSPDDWQEILWAASKLNRDAKDSKEPDRFQALVMALYSYSGLDEAARREPKFRTLDRIFGGRFELL